MGQVDIEKEHPNVVKMKILGAKLVSVTQGTATLKDAVDSAFEEYLKDPTDYIYAIGSVVGPHPFPMMVRDFQSIIGKEIKEQTHERFGANTALGGAKPARACAPDRYACGQTIPGALWGSPGWSLARFTRKSSA
jgi:tryptophan synthase beta subunit